MSKHDTPHLIPFSAAKEREPSKAMGLVERHQDFFRHYAKGQIQVEVAMEGETFSCHLVKGTISVSDMFYKQQGEGATPEQAEGRSVFGVLHEIEHLLELRAMIEREGGVDVYKAYIKRIEKSRAFSLMDNLVANIRENTAVIQKTSADMQEVERGAYRDRLFPTTDFSSLPKHLQFCYAFIREARVPGEVCTVAEDVREALRELVAEKEVVAAMADPNTFMEHRLELQDLFVWPKVQAFLKEDMADRKEKARQQSEKKKQQNAPKNQEESEDNGDEDESNVSGDGGEGEENQGDEQDEQDEQDERGGSTGVGSEDDNDEVVGDSDEEDGDGDDAGEGNGEGESEGGDGDDEQGGTASNKNEDGEGDGDGKDSSGDNDDENIQPDNSDSGNGAGQGKTEEDDELPELTEEEWKDPNIVFKKEYDEWDAKSTEAMPLEEIEKAVEEWEKVQASKPSPEETAQKAYAEKLGVSLEELLAYRKAAADMMKVVNPLTSIAVHEELRELFLRIIRKRIKKAPTPKYPLVEGDELLDAATLYAEVRGGNLEPKVWADMEIKERRGDTCGDVWITLVCDRSKSMNNGGGSKAMEQRRAAVLLMETLKEFGELCEEERTHMSDVLSIATEVYTFNGTVKDAEPLKEMGPELEEVDRIRILKTLQTCNGDSTTDYQSLKAIIDSITQEEVERMKNGSLKRIVFVLTDGDSSSAEKVREHLKTLSALGVVVVGVGITASGKSVLNTYAPHAEVAETAELLPVVLGGLLHEHLEPI